MAMGTERSKPLHNFTMPGDLRWGNQRFLRCMKINNKTENHNDFLHKGNNNEISAVREKVMLDLQTAADKMKESILKEGEVSTVSAEANRPWNLRTRRAACRNPVNECSGKEALNVDLAKKPNIGSQMKATAAAAAAGVVAVVEKSPRLRSGEKKERAKFSVALTKREIEEDFLGIIGHRSPRRPKKRARNVQKQLDTLFPGLWLTEVTPDMYRVPEPAP
ncbi:hypothetical protein ACJIZ3_019691 [Penstemon smallii]|uniref:DUF1639 family protein n=1 Tax=Penstemon smallii TaxID=265156 RepID=A0ABD3T1V3_9LAMI